ncbi:hypothetical protein CTI14_46240, partial [Methylobacterium radiotolerans]
MHTHTLTEISAMPLSMYQASVPVFIRGLNVLAALLSGPDASALVWRFFQGQRRTGGDCRDAVSALDRWAIADWRDCSGARNGNVAATGGLRGG